MNEEIIEQTSEQSIDQSKGARLFNSLFGKWFLHRLSAFFIWYWFLLRFLHLDLPGNLTFSFEYLLLPSAITTFLMIVFGQWARLFFYPFYVFTFPGLVLFLITRGIYRVVKFPLVAGKFAFSSRTILLSILVLLAVLPISIYASNAKTAATAALIAHLFIFFLFLQVFRLASNPYKPLTGILQFLSSTGSSWVETSFIKPGLTKDGQTRQTAITFSEWIIKGIDRIYPESDYADRGIAGFARAGVVPFAMAVFIIIFILIAVSFAIVHMKLELAWGPQISGLGSSPSLWDYFYTSLLIEATAIPNQISPITILGQILILWNLLSGILLLTLLLAMFTTSVGIHGESSVEEIGLILSSERERYSSWLETIKLANSSDENIIGDEFTDKSH